MQDAGRAWSEEALARIAALGRACLPVSMPAQVAAFQQCMDTLQHAQATELQGLQAMEQLWWLLQLCACTLADSGEGETPQVPGEIIDACESDSGAAVLECTGKLGRYLVQVWPLFISVMRAVPLRDCHWSISESVTVTESVTVMAVPAQLLGFETGCGFAIQTLHAWNGV